jgi:hypothetical protein
MKTVLLIWWRWTAGSSHRLPIPVSASFKSIHLPSDFTFPLMLLIQRMFILLVFILLTLILLLLILRTLVLLIFMLHVFRSGEQ